MIAVTGTRVMIDFMSDFFNIVSESIYPRYANIDLGWLSGKRMSYESFMEFAKDHEIFPAHCS